MNRMSEREADFERADATRRTRLASERTYLAWWRSGLTAFAVSVGFGKVVPSLTGAERWPYALVGAFYGLLGTVFIAYGAYRQRALERALDRGEFLAPSPVFMLALAVSGIVVGLFTLGLVISSV